MATLASFTLTSGRYNSPYGPVFYGFIAGQHPNMPQTGSINGSTEYATPTSWYSTTSLWNLYFLDYYVDQVQLRLRGATASPANSGWASMSIASYGPYNRIDGSYTALNNPTYPRNATWTWTTNTNPLFSGDYTVTIDDGVSLPVADTEITVAPSGNFAIAYTDTSVLVNVSNAGSSTEYRLLKGTTEVASETGTATSFNLSTTSIPAAGGSSVYKIQGRVGSGAWEDAHTFTVSRGAAPVVSGTTYSYNRNSVNKNDIVKNVFLDDTIALSVTGLTGIGWTISTTNCTASPQSGYSGSGNTTANSQITFSSTGAYSANFVCSPGFDIDITGTVSDPYVITPANNFLSKSSISPSASNVESAAVDFVTARSGETLSFSVTDGELEKNDSGTWATTGTISGGDTYKIRRNASASYSTAVTATVSFTKNSVEKGTVTYTVTTRAQDVSPNSFDLGGPANFHNRNTYIYPPLVTVSGIDSDADIAVSVSGTTGAFAYSKNGGAYTTDADTVTLNDTVQARIRTSSDYNTQRSLTLNIGNQSDTYYATTEIYYTLGANVSNAEKSAITYRNFVVASSAYGSAYVTFTASGTADTKVSTDNATWVNSVTRKNGQVVYVKATASSSYASTTTATVTGGGIAPSFSITTRAQDTTPDAFTLGSSSGVNRGSYGYSSEITIAGMASDASVTASLSGDSGKLFRYKTSSTGAWSAWGTSNVTGVTNGYVFQVALTASTSFSTDKTCSLDVGGTSSTFTVTSEASVSPDTSVSFSTNTPAYEDTSFTLTTTGGGSITDYVVRTTSYTGTSVGTFTGNASDLTINDTPSIAGTTYYVTGSVSNANDGTGVSSNVGTFTVTRSSGGGSGNENPDGTYGLELYDESGNLYLSISDNVAFFKFSGSGEYTPGTRVAPRTFTQVIDLSAYNLDITSDDFVYIHDRNKGGIAVFSAEITGQDEVTVTIYQLALSPNSNTRSYSYTIISTG